MVLKQKSEAEEAKGVRGRAGERGDGRGGELAKVVVRCTTEAADER